MELIKKKYYYPGIINSNLSAETLNFQVLLSQDLFNTGIYTDAKNPIPEVITGFTAVWDLSYDGSLQKDCKTTNRCLVRETISNVTIHNGDNGSIETTITNLGSVDCPSPVELFWVGPDGFTSSNPNVTGLISGNYTLKIVDADCNRTFKRYFISQPPGLDASLIVNNSQVNATNNFCNGSAQVIATGGVPPYTYAWYSANTTAPVLSTTAQITNLCLGSSYYVVVTDADGTEITQFFELTLPDPLSGRTISVTNIDCQGTPGSIEVEGIGGIQGTGYTYQLLTSPIIQNNTGLFETISSSGNYTVRITDSVGQIFDLYVSVTQPILPITINIISTPNVSSDGTDGDIPTNPDGQISFSISGGQGITPPGGSCCVYNVSIESNFELAGYSFLNSSVNDGNYVLANSTTFYSLSSGGYRITASDNECETSLDTYLEHSYVTSVGISSTSTSGQLRADVSNPSGYYWAIIKWDDGSTPGFCAAAVAGTSFCGTTSIPSNSHLPGTEVALEVIWVNAITPGDQSLWRSFKRIFKMP